TPPHRGIVMVTPVSFPFFTVSTNFLNPLLNTRRSAPCPRSPAPSALPPWQTPQTFRNHDRPSAIAFASPDKGFVAGTSDSARATEPPPEPHPLTTMTTATAVARAIPRSFSFIALCPLARSTCGPLAQSHLRVPQ